MRGSGQPREARPEGNPIRPQTGKRVPVSIPGYEGFEFYAVRWERERMTTTEGANPLTWCLYIDEKAICWADTRPECVRVATQWLDGCGGPDWLEARLGYPHDKEREVEAGAWEMPLAGDGEHAA